MTARRRQRTAVALVAAGLTALVACARSDPPRADASDTPTGGFGTGNIGVDPFDGDAALGARAEALFASCAGGPETTCHSSGAGSLTLRLGPGGDVVNVPSSERPELMRVRPYAPLSSYLFLKVTGDGGIDGGRMPLGGTFDPRIPALVDRWIEAGAPSP